MASFSANATGPYSIEAEFTGLSVQTYARTIYINIVGMGSSYQEEWSLGANEDPDDYYAEFDGLDPGTKYTVACTVYRNSDWVIVAEWSKNVTTDTIYYIEGAISTNDSGGILSVYPDGEIECSEGEEVTFEAEVDDNHIFRGWFTRASGSASYLKTRDNPYTITVDNDLILYARATEVSLSTSELTYNSVFIEMSSAYEEFDYYLRVWDNTNGKHFINKQSLSYDEVYNGYTIEGLSPETSYSINIGYEAGSEASLIWIFDTSHTATIITPAEPRYYVGINYANGIQSGQYWGDDISDANKALQGTSVSFSATAKSGYIFYGWYDENENYISDANPYTIDSIEEDTTLIAKAIPDTAFLVSYESIDIETIGSVTEEAKVYHNSKLLETIDPESNDMFQVSAKVYPSSTYTIKITYNCDLRAAGAVTNYESITESYEVTTYTPELSASVNNNQVTVSLNAGYGTGWSVYFSSPFEEDTFADMSTSSSKAIFTYLKYNTKYEFYCNYRVASGTGYTTKTLEVSATTPNTSPTYSVACYKDDNTVASFGKSPNTTFKYRDEVTVTATAISGNYQYDYTTPKIYEGTSASGDLVSSSGSYTHIVIANISFYAQGTRTKREYEADIEATYVSDTSQKITITNLSSTSGLNSYYYITENTSSSPVTSLSSAKSFARSTGYITLTDLESGEHTYYCYVYNSTYGYYYLIGSVTFISGTQVELWEWTTAERAAFTGKGKFNVLTASRWIAFCERFNEVVDAKSYASSLKITVPDIVSGDILTAEGFNHVTNQIAWLGHAYFGQEDFYEGRTIVSKGDLVLGQYFIDLETALNNLINAL